MVNEYATDPDFCDVMSAIALGKTQEPYVVQDGYLLYGSWAYHFKEGFVLFIGCSSSRKEGIKKNLLYVSSLAKNGLRVIFEDDRCIVRDRENGYSLITTGTLENGLFVLDRYEKQIQACIAKTKTQAMQDAELWHARFGHVGYGSLMTLQRHNMVHDLSLLEMPPRHVCEGCVLGKMHRFAFSQDGSVRATRKLQLVHSDVCGPMRTPSVGNSLYFVTFIDDFSRFCWVYPLKAKSDVFAFFQHYVSMVENETGCKVQTLRTDRGGEYMSGAFKDFLGKKGIKHQCTMPYTPQQNGVAERKNRSLMEMARCMLKAKSLPHKLWMEVVACAAHVLNRCPTCALKTITPYESWYDKKPSVSYLCVFGCLAYAHIPQQLRGKLDDKAVKCIFVGYSSGSKGYRLYNPARNKIFESHDVNFAETTAQPMVAFDVPHMQTQDVFEGFLPSFVENQESQQVDNFDQSFDQHVTPHDVEEIVREEQEVLRDERTFPKWVQKTLQDSKLDAPLPHGKHVLKEDAAVGPGGKTGQTVKDGPDAIKSAPSHACEEDEDTTQIRDVLHDLKHGGVEGKGTKKGQHCDTMRDSEENSDCEDKDAKRNKDKPYEAPQAMNSAPMITYYEEPNEPYITKPKPPMYVEEAYHLWGVNKGWHHHRM
ncbi:hypothetical protein L7F22_028734 [Adiantum nelumboides]|nr:hypothetical protein [Adiantum nelumboides]